MLERGPGARFAKSVFYEHVNDVDVYIEDTSDTTKKVLSILLSRALGGKLRLETIFPLGNKQEVLDACIDSQDDGDDRPKLFVVDGDFSCLGCYSYPRYKFLCSLPRYCTENYLIDAEAFLTILFEEDATRDVDELDAAFDFEGWIHRNLTLLSRLFAGYAVAHCMSPETPTVSRPVRQLVSDASGNLDPVKVGSVIEDLRRAVEKVYPRGFFDSQLASVQARYLNGKSHAILAAVSAKAYLLPLLLMRLRSLVSVKSTNASIQIRLAQRGDVTDLAFIRDIVFPAAA